jgi:hypothetical protein
LPDEHVLPHKLKPWQRTEAVAWHTLPSLFVTAELSSRMNAAMGWDLSEFYEAIQAISYQWATAGGLYDKQIRKDFGLPPRG